MNLTNKENKFQIVDFTDKTGFTDPDDQASGPQGLVQITDNRGGMPQGWTLTVSGSALGYSGGDDIKGATLNIYFVFRPQALKKFLYASAFFGRLNG